MNFINIVYLLKKSPALLYIAAFIYSSFHCWYRLSYWRALFSRNCKFKGAFLKDVQFEIHGGMVTIGPRSQLYNCKICMNGSHNELNIKGSGTCVKNTSFLFHGCNSKCVIAEKFTMEGGSINLLEGKCINIGSDCMFSSNIYITVSDFHTILCQQNGNRVNVGEDVTIGNHVWLGRNVSVLKGASIADNSIVGTGAIVSKSLDKSCAIYVGTPARLIKDNVDWNREH